MQRFTVLKWMISVGIICYVVYEFYTKFNWGFSSFDFQRLSSGQLVSLVLNILILGAVNIVIEAVKWRYLMKPFEPINWRTAFSSVFTGLSLAVITPNRIGDLAGKAYQLKSTSKLKGLCIALLGHAAQFVCIFIIGAFAMNSFFSIQQFYFKIILTVLSIFVFVLYLKLDKFINWLGQFRFFIKSKMAFEGLEIFGFKQKMYLLFLSLLKYQVFVGQFYLLLVLFGVEITIDKALNALFCTYFVQLFVPSFLLLELGVRGAAALYFIGHYATMASAILLASYVLWVLNIGLPALIGLYFFNKKTD